MTGIVKHPKQSPIWMARKDSGALVFAGEEKAMDLLRQGYLVVRCCRKTDL